MGLDIGIAVNNYRELLAYEKTHRVERQDSLFYQHSLSRTFCNFMCRQDVVSDEPELDQIGRITGVDIRPLYEMNTYPDEEDEFGMEFQLQWLDSEEARSQALAKAEQTRQHMAGNIDQVRETIDGLIHRLETIPDLPALLLPTERDTLDRPSYFASFQSDKGDGYIGNNFGQDLRNFRSFLDYAKSKGTTTVWFTYG